MSGPQIGNVWGFTTFADDLREEVGGKLSLMGIYQTEYVVTAPALPLVFPKLVAMVNYFELAGAITSDLKFRITFPEGMSEALPPLEKVMLRSTMTVPPAEKRIDDEGNPTMNNFRIPFVISPFPFLAEGDIKVRCHFDDGTVLRLGRLQLILRVPNPGPNASERPA